MVIAFLLVFGLAIGSFINAFVWRFNQGRLKSLWNDRSECTHCHKKLGPAELIPVVSYLLQKGTCAHCGKRIDDKPWTEVITPLLFVGSYLAWPLTLHSGQTWTAFIVWLGFVTAFVALGLYDVKWFELPHRIVLPLIGLALLQVVVAATLLGQGWPELIGSLEGAAVGGGIFLAIYLVSPKQKLEDGTIISKWIGFGDITLGTLIGLVLGGPAAALLMIFVASVLGTLLAIPLMATGRAAAQTHLPFGPFLMLAAIIVKLYGLQLIDWYSRQIL